jgi:hypothetical protein
MPYECGVFPGVGPIRPHVSEGGSVDRCSSKGIVAKGRPAAYLSLTAFTGSGPAAETLRVISPPPGNCLQLSGRNIFFLNSL